jgi:hypothetical protein
VDPAWVTAALALTVAVVGVAGWGLRMAWKMISRTTRFLDDFFGEPERPGVKGRPGVMARLDAMEGSLLTLQTEVTPNSGHSMRDSVKRTEAAVAAVKRDVADVKRRVDELADGSSG